MYLFHIGLHKVSLGTLVLALGLLVDDAIIAVETMAVKLEQGYDRLQAAAFAYTSTAFPMLTGTLVTVSGFSADRACEIRSYKNSAPTGAFFCCLELGMAATPCSALVNKKEGSRSVRQLSRRQ